MQDCTCAKGLRQVVASNGAVSCRPVTSWTYIVLIVVFGSVALLASAAAAYIWYHKTASGNHAASKLKGPPGWCWLCFEACIQQVYACCECKCRILQLYTNALVKCACCVLVLTFAILYHGCTRPTQTMAILARFVMQTPLALRTVHFEDMTLLAAA